MNEFIEIGKYNTLKIARKLEQGLYLETKDSTESVLLPNAYINDGMQIGNLAKVFVYTDSLDRPVATTLKPKAILHECVYAEVKDTTSFGAFVDIGLPKDLFVPKAHQKTPFVVGQSRVIFIDIDDDSKRLYGSEKIGRFLYKDTSKFKQNQQVNLFIMAKTPLGYKVVVDNLVEAMIYDSEIFEDIKIGENRKGFVKQIRKDGKLDASLQPIGIVTQEVYKEKILKAIRENDYLLPLTSKSSPEDIYNYVKMSKKNFKSTIQLMIQDGSIKISDNGVSLLFAPK